MRWRESRLHGPRGLSADNLLSICGYEWTHWCHGSEISDIYMSFLFRSGFLWLLLVRLWVLYASCVESLFPLLLFHSLCSDMSLSPSPKFPSFTEGSEARDCDLPWGWVKDSPPSSAPSEMGRPPRLFILYTPESLILLDRLTMCRKSGCIWFPAGLFWVVLMDRYSCMESLCVNKKSERVETYWKVNK